MCADLFEMHSCGLNGLLDISWKHYIVILYFPKYTNSKINSKINVKTQTNKQNSVLSCFKEIFAVKICCVFIEHSVHLLNIIYFDAMYNKCWFLYHCMCAACMSLRFPFWIQNLNILNSAYKDWISKLMILHSNVLILNMSRPR